MKRVAVIGESPYDTQPLCEVWNKRFGDKGRFSVFLKRIEGSALYSAKITDIITGEMKRVSANYDLFVLVTDLDAERSNRSQTQRVEEWFRKISAVLPESLLLINIQELEALILGDIDLFNKEYKSRVKAIANPENVSSPKDFLISQTRKNKKTFAVIDNKTLIPKLDFGKVEANCRFYREFIQELESRL
jgi:hypothetical protein